MREFFLILCLLIDGDLQYQMTLNDKAYRSMAECQQVKNHPRIIEDYGRFFLDQQIVLICSEVKR